MSVIMPNTNREQSTSCALARTLSSPQPNKCKSDQNQYEKIPPNDTSNKQDPESGLVNDQLRRRQDTDEPAVASIPQNKVGLQAGRKPSLVDSMCSVLSSSLELKRKQQKQPEVPTEPSSLLEQFQPTSKARRRQPAKSRFINPSGSVCYWWSAVVSLAFLYNFWAASFRFAFSEIDTIWSVWIAIDLVAELIYYLDIVANRKTGYLEDGVLQRDPKKIRVHYQESNLFYLDVFCVLPFDILYLSFGFNSILRCNRLVKIHKFWSFVDRTERHTNYPNVFRTCTLVHNILVIFHWNACIFHMISTHKIIDIERLYKIEGNHCKDISCQYLHAFYWSTLAIIGDLPQPKTKGEYVYVIIELIFGLILFAWVLGHVANIVTNVSAARKEFQARLDAVKTFMRTRRVSDELQTKVIRWFDYLWSSQKSSDEERSVACLPDRLKAEIAIHVNLDTLKRVDIFQATEVGFLRELVLRLKPVLFSPGDYVCRKDEAGHEMYIVSRGILEVVTNEGQTVVATFRAGSYFGEIAVLNVGAAGNKRTASVRSVGYSDLFCLSKQDLWDVLKDYPKAEARIRAVAEERLTALGAGRRAGLSQHSSQRRSRNGRGPDPNGAAPSQLGPGRNQDGYSSTSMLNNIGQNNNNNEVRRLSQRSSRSRVQHDATSANKSDQLECFASLIPVGQPVRLRPYGSATSHRPTGAAGSQFRGRKCLNSRTMEPICNSAEMASQQQQPPMLMLGHLPIGLSEAVTRGMHGHHHCHHCHQHASATLFDGCHCHAHHNEHQQPLPVTSHSGGCTTAGLLNFPPASPRQASLQDGGTIIGHRLSVQPHLGQSRSFECSPVAGVGGSQQPLCAANRSRSGASLSTRTTPPQTSDDNQTLAIEQPRDIRAWQDASDPANNLPRTLSMHHHNRDQPVMCVQQGRQPQSRLWPGHGEMRGRSSSMTTEPTINDDSGGPANAPDDDFGFDAGDEEECDREDDTGHAYQWHNDDLEQAAHHQAGGAPGRAGVSAATATRRQRHRQDCRHHASTGDSRTRSARGQDGTAATSDSLVLCSLASNAAMPPYGAGQQPAGCVAPSNRATTTTKAVVGANPGDQSTTSSSTSTTPAAVRPAIDAREQLVVEIDDDKANKPAETSGSATRWSSEVAGGISKSEPGECRVEIEPADLRQASVESFEEFLQNTSQDRD